MLWALIDNEIIKKTVLQLNMLNTVLGAVMSTFLSVVIPLSVDADPWFETYHMHCPYMLAKPEQYVFKRHKAVVWCKSGK